ncbi:RDD family protein [Haladaptatus litoreus]|uniref:RDD family protein n=1 Tax=Haladaptatus litoreus TaxID=553468 RepID=UPI001FE3D702|nr:RDD family protein [Haladaptatus litoreus]
MDNSPTRDDTQVVGSRIGAQIVDSIAMFVIAFIPAFIVGFIGGLLGIDGLSGIGILLSGLAALCYWLLIESLWDGYTIGKRLFDIRVVQEDGSPCSLGSSAILNLLEIIDGFFYYLIRFIAMAITDKRQRLGDRVAGTVVVSESSVEIATKASTSGTSVETEPSMCSQ